MTDQFSSRFPLPVNPESAESRLKDFIQSCIDRGLTEVEKVLAKKQNSDLLRSILVDSPYLSTLISKNQSFFVKLMEGSPDDCLEDINRELADLLPEKIETEKLKGHLRTAKARVALLTAWGDLSGQWPLPRITGTLSHFAETCLKLSVDHLIAKAVAAGDLELTGGADTPSGNSGYTVLGMGKLGGRELNYSSDIDLIVLFDQDIVRYTGRKSAKDLFVRITRSLVNIMQDRTAEGYVFRTDLRLRPDPGAMPVAMSMAAAETYYQSVGLNWERAAMIKARPVAGDLLAGQEFLDRIRGFVWRKHLDYAALEDIYAIKKLIHKHHKHGDIALAGQDIKLGPGGIREIEFFAQIHQLISGGREPALRVAPTCTALDVLVEEGHLEQEDNQILQTAYVYFRTLEHRLQMINDDQTHSIPERPEDIYRIARFMGFENVDEFDKATLFHLEKVHGLFDDLLKDSRQTPDSTAEQELQFPAGDYHPETMEVIRQNGFTDPQGAYDIIQNWLLGRYRACRTERARNILRGLIVHILEAFSHSDNPDGALRRFDDFLSKLPSGVQLFAFINAHPWLLELLTEIMVSAPSLSEQLARRPLLLDAVLTPDFFTSFPEREELEESLSVLLETARDFQDVLDIMRKWANEQKFQIGVQILRNVIDARTSGKLLTTLAEVVVSRMLREVMKEFAIKHGNISGGTFCILAMGKLGGYELTTTSDLDLVFIYDAGETSGFSDGQKSLSVNHYFARLGQNVINALTALTGEGKLYEVDMRLRPSGNAGPIAVNLSTFNEYQEGKAWTWEHMALTRARPIAGDDVLSEKVRTAIYTILTHKNRDQENLLFEVSKMRNRMRQEFKTDNLWAVKHMRGGLVDIEFICQYLLLAHASTKPGILSTNTLEFLEKVAGEKVITREVADILSSATLLMQKVQLILRLCVGSASKSENKPPALVKILLQRTGTGSLEELEEKIRHAQAGVYGIYEEIIEKPASSMLPPAPVTPLGNPVDQATD
ncbi:bifunctional [glutamine synthetase] adenylyltransferase/[glutamine synthetase]-adenylyl-L-tyrosine phosphorylase [Emcibacter sp.]|uniref:bifunctional [glutamine synthetase] adenylyltransferase/[glutamine synthetase]-adenylyl-L-tyrosine phosphorylase n=1 Tax=Emcibacter sp. TaxID=1979954 RepID=UPI002AA88C51|nr:bifunctional [glutamine synthetase] adenylyltransferase/[glutamine synthetase]-adenylyl-L-tyrosine phosphorylase [Emcibacter sp.]